VRGGAFSRCSANPQCGPLNTRSKSRPASIDCLRTSAPAGQYRRTEGGVWLLLGQNDCGRSIGNTPLPKADSSATVRVVPVHKRSSAGAESGHIWTLCVRTCDGYYFPISYAPGARQICRRRAGVPAALPGSRVACSGRRSRRKISHAISTSGKLFRAPTAFAIARSSTGYGCPRLADPGRTRDKARDVWARRHRGEERARQPRSHA
jgi:hypothetical protein